MYASALTLASYNYTKAHALFQQKENYGIEKTRKSFYLMQVIATVPIVK